RPQTYCWFISLGPYDCRAWTDGNGVDSDKAVLPDNGYKKLGDFEGLNLKKAFNDQLVLD
ncbi:MAG: hypothetical protein KDD22_04845, partial [Bdellovibrionales bacterium]|nr:hypothetical protein [Bdellovibrionales bacterium]